MWNFAKKLLSRSRSMNVLLGDVIFETQPIGGSSSHSFLKWRVKRSIDGHGIYIGVLMRPDGYAGPEGSPTNYMSFDVAAATLLRDTLDQCIAVAQQQLVNTTSPDAK
jgi:hypothetical protein